MQPKYRIELLNKKQHDITDFNCGVDALDRYLKERAGQEIKKRITVVYVLCEYKSQNIIGYYSLSNYSIELESLPKDTAKKIPRYPLIATTLIGRMAIHKSFQGKKIGTYLLMDALKRSYTLSRQVGSYAVIVDAKDEKSRNFYEKLGFKQFPKKPFKLFLEMGSIKTLVKN